MKRFFPVALIACLSAPALASNFSYTNIDVSLGVLRLDESLQVEDEIYEELGTFALSGSAQINSNFALSLGVSVLSNEGPHTEVSGSAVTLGMAFPFAASEFLDVVPALGLLSVESKFCGYSVCHQEDESGIAYGVGLRLWAMPDTIEVMAGIIDSTLADSTATVSIGAALWWQRQHSLRLNYGARRESDRLRHDIHYVNPGVSEFAIGYRFSW